MLYKIRYDCIIIKNRNKRDERHSHTRRTVLKTTGALASVGTISGAVTANTGGDGKYNGLYEFPDVASEYEQYRSVGDLDKARALLSENDIGYGYASAVPVETADGIESLTTDLGGPYSQGSPPVTADDLWEKSGAGISLSATKLGEDDVEGYPDPLSRFRVSLQLSLSDGNLVTPDGRGPFDVAAISFEDTHWLARTTSFWRTPGSIGEGGSVESDEIKADHFRWRFNEPKPVNVNDGQYVVSFEGESYMHPNADGVSQVYGHYSHAWNVFTGAIDSISVGYGAFSVTTTTGADDWELNTDPLLVTD